MYCIGLTGGIASGKSTVVNMFRSFGAAIIDCDVIARDVVEPGSAALEKVAKTFGPESLLPDGSMNRAYIGSLVFADKEKKKALEDILFPLIHQEIDAEIKCIHGINPQAIIILDMPLLFEIKYEAYVDEAWLVYVDPETQVQRLMARNHYTQDEALARIHAQMPIDQKRQLARVIIDNTGDVDATEQQVRREWRLLQERIR